MPDPVTSEGLPNADQRKTDLPGPLAIMRSATGLIKDVGIIGVLLFVGWFAWYKVLPMMEAREKAAYNLSEVYEAKLSTQRESFAAQLEKISSRNQEALTALASSCSERDRNFLQALAQVTDKFWSQREEDRKLIRDNNQQLLDILRNDYRRGERARYETSTAVNELVNKRGGSQ